MITTAKLFFCSAQDKSTRYRGRLVWLGRAGFLQSRMRLPWIIWLSLLAMLTMQRIALVCLDSTVQANQELRRDLIDMFAIGLRYDLVIASMAIVPAMLILYSVPVTWVSRCLLQIILAGYGSVILGFMLFLSIADLFYFQQFGTRLDDKVLQYLLASDNEYLFHIAAHDYPFLPVAFLILVAMAVIFIGLLRMGFDNQYVRGPRWHGIWPILSVLLVILAIRGTMSSHAINLGLAYANHSPRFAQLATNPAFTLRQAIITSWFKKENPTDLYDLPDSGDPMKNALEKIIQPTDRAVDNPTNPLHRITQASHPRQDWNVVLVVLESIHWRYIGGMGGAEDLTPHLNRLMKESIVFNHCYSTGDRTERGMVALAGGFPDLLGSSASIRSDSVASFFTIGQVLKQRKYHTFFVNGGPPHRDHRAVFLGSNGFDRVYGDQDMRYKTFRSKLGWCDHDMFRTTHDLLIENHRSGIPFFAMLLTMSNHKPYAIPSNVPMRYNNDDTPDAAALNAIRYTDWALGQFLEQAKGSDYFKNTIFVMTADHMGGPWEHPHTPDSFRIPFVIHAPFLSGKTTSSVDTVCSQADIPPTILSLLGGTYEHCFFGSSVLDRPSDRGFAFGQSDRVVYYIDAHRRAIQIPPYRGQSRLFDLASPETKNAIPGNAPMPAHSLRNSALSLLHASHLLYDRQIYHIKNWQAVEEKKAF